MNGRIYYINFSGNKGSEINKTHLGIIFSIPKVKNMVFCIPLTSPKIKHFKTQNGFINRKHLDLKFQNLPSFFENVIIFHILYHCILLYIHYHL